MWSSSQETTPILTPPSCSWILPDPSPVEPRCPTYASLGSIESATCDVDKIVMERMEADAGPPPPPPQQQEEQLQRGRTVGKKRAVFGRVRQLLLSRSRSASRDGSSPSSARERSFSSSSMFSAPEDAVAQATVDGKAFKTSPAPRRLFLSRKAGAPATEEAEEMGGSAAERPRPDRRMGREENFFAAMGNKLVHAAFAAFCKKTLSWENIEFVLQVSIIICFFVVFFCLVRRLAADRRTHALTGARATGVW